ncbi:polyphosphate polymerase domain-containing protein [Butyrivibrio sp. MB2005]|uniref:polyphosphate polymerase domain-containing protein n=1 Tax=Butyrivibrio sp. MB2005 TaxID=1280678 RepID=UPI0003F586A7|nr:polyphosphate polymerase domain-containing protein [Butyrivibrio sp. MB2005]
MSDKFRHEYKYLVSDQQIVLLQQRLKFLIPFDSHASEDGIYSIRSLYFDDYNDRCLKENIAGVAPREKFRIRIYNCDSTRITLECKRKEHDKVQKKSCPLTIEQCVKLMNGEVLTDLGSQPTVLKKLTLEMMTHMMQPKIIVGYDRMPYVNRLGNVRVTLDMNLYSSKDIRRFLEEDISKRPVMPKGQHLMEVKWDEFIPDTIFRACQLENLRQTAYSKYSLCRKYKL